MSISTLEQVHTLDEMPVLRPAGLKRQPGKRKNPNVTEVHTGLEGTTDLFYARPDTFGFEARHEELRQRLGDVLFDKLKNPQDEEGELFSN